MTLQTLLVALRLIGYLLVVLVGLAVVGIAAYLEYIQHWHPAVYMLPFISGIITAIILLPMIVLDRIRRDAAFHQPRIELVWAGAVVLLWLASALYMTLQLKGFPSCSLYSGALFPWNHQSEETWCKLNRAMEWLLWSGFIIGCSTFAGILIFTLYNDFAGYPHVWKCSISDFDRDYKATHSSRRSSRRLSTRLQDLEETLSQLRPPPPIRPMSEDRGRRSVIEQRYQAATRDTPDVEGENTPASTSAFPRPPSPSLSVASAMRALGYTTPRRENHSNHSQNSSTGSLPPRPALNPRSGAEGAADSFESLRPSNRSAHTGTAGQGQAL